MIATNTYAQRALELAKQGYTTIPLIGKRPITDGWQNLRAITPDMVADWERNGCYKNLGMVCGAASGNVVVIDFDGMAAYELFKKQFPELAETLTVATGSGNGAHVYFKVDLLPDSIGAMGIPVPDTGELVNIEVKADGKQVVIPPSIHPDTNKPYIKMVDKPIRHQSDLTALIAWIKALKPQTDEWRPPANRTASTGQMNPRLLAAVENYFLAQSHKMHREWINCSCPNTSAHKHGDKTFSFGYNTEKHFGYCYTCEGGREYLVKDLLPLMGIDAQAYGGLFERSEALVPGAYVHTSPIPTSAPEYVPNITPLNDAPVMPSIPVITRSSRLTAYSNRVFDFDTPVTAVPVPFPLPALHSFGGLARVIKPGFLMGIVGVSGGGKTSLLETMVDSWLNYHVPSLVWSPEWDGDDFVARAVQRYGGASVDDLYLHELFKYEKQNGIQGGAGVELTPEKLKATNEAIRTLRGWTDEVGYLDMPCLTVGYLQAAIEATLKSLTFKPRVLVIDYAQLLHAMEANSNLTMYNLMMKIKGICKVFGLVGVVATQTTKNSAKGVADGKLLDSLDARYVNDDPFNLFITVNPEYVKETGDLLPSAILRVTKNSMGGKGKRRVGVHWEKMLFDSFSHPSQSFETEE